MSRMTQDVLALADSQMKEVLDTLVGFQSPPYPALSAANARQLPTPDYAVRVVLATRAGSRVKSFFAPSPEPVSSVVHRIIPGAAGDDILLRIYTPKDAGPGPYPVLVYFHGGGWVIGGLDTYDASCRGLCNAVGCVVVAVAYHQAPEYRYPAAVKDAYAAYQWAWRHATEIHGDPGQVAVAGEGAGGNLATVVTLLARDESYHAPLHQALIYPICNYAFDTPSYLEYANARPLSRPAMEWFYNTYLQNPAQGSDPYASPLRASLAGLPPATIITAQIDPLNSEGRAYAARLQEAGVRVNYQNYDGVTHEFFGMKAVLDKAKDALGVAADDLRKAFANRTLKQVSPVQYRESPMGTTPITAEPVVREPDDQSAPEP